MSVYVTIDGEQRSLTDVNEQWVSEKYRLAPDRNPCVVVQIKSGDDIDVIMASESCPSGSGRGVIRELKTEERRIFDLWARHHRASSQGDLTSFLQQVRSLI